VNILLLTVAIPGLFLAISQSCESRELDDAEKKLIIEKVTRDFLDPDAARFRWLPVPDNLGVKADGVFYCGQVNGKNSFGAYTGFVPFSSMLVVGKGRVLHATLIAVGNTDAGRARTLQFCSKHGLDPNTAK
jgi:hypothetical protein